MGWVEAKYPGMSPESIPMAERYFNSLFYSIMAVLMVGDDDESMVCVYRCVPTMQCRFLF